MDRTLLTDEERAALAEQWRDNYDDHGAELAEKDAEIERLRAECLRLQYAEAEAMALVLSQEEQIRKWKRAADEGHPQPCTLGPQCPYCEIERLRGLLREAHLALSFIPDPTRKLLDLRYRVREALGDE